MKTINITDSKASLNPVQFTVVLFLISFLLLVRIVVANFELPTYEVSYIYKPFSMGENLSAWVDPSMITNYQAAPLVRPQVEPEAIAQEVVVMPQAEVKVAPSAPVASVPMGTSSEINQAALVALTNSARVAGGLGSLSVDQRLTNAAYAKAQDMFAKQYWAHYGPNGETPWQFVQAQGYAYSWAGENLAKGFSTNADVHNGWMASAAHREAILTGHYVNVGIAAVDGMLLGEQVTLVVQLFGTPVVQAQVIEPNKVEQITALLSSLGSPHTDKAQFMHDTAIKHGLDPLLMVSIFGAESSLGKNCWNFNCYGWWLNDSGDTWHKGVYTSYEEATDRIYAEFASVYGKCGSDIRCVSGIDRGSGYNVRQSWVDSVGWFYNKLSK